MSDWEETQTLEEFGEELMAKLDRIVALLEMIAGEKPTDEVVIGETQITRGYFSSDVSEEVKK